MHWCDKALSDIHDALDNYSRAIGKTKAGLLEDLLAAERAPKVNVYPMSKYYRLVVTNETPTLEFAAFGSEYFVCDEDEYTSKDVAELVYAMLETNGWL